MCGCRKFHIADFDMTESAIVEFGIRYNVWMQGIIYVTEFDLTEYAMAEFGIMHGCRETYIAEFDMTESAIVEFGIMCG